jgi:hypothetical protein
MATASRRPCSPPLEQPLPGLPHVALQRYLPAAVVAQLAQACGVRGYRRVYDPVVMLWGLVAGALGGHLSQEAVVERLAAGLGRPLSAGSGGFCRAQARQSVALMRACAEHVAAVAAGFVRACGTSIEYALDGFFAALADTAANQARYPQSSSQRGGCGWPLLHAVALVDQGTGCICALSLGSLHDHDAKLAKPLWERLAPGDVLAADRGFASYGLLAGATARGWTAVVRQHQRRLNQSALVGDSDDGHEVWARPKRCAPWWDDPQPQQLAVRVVRQRLSGGRELVVNTNASPDQLSKEQVLACYEQRWRIETRFLELKAYLALEPLRAQDPERCELLLWSWVLAYNLVRCVMCEAALARGVSPYELSFVGALAVLAAALVWPAGEAEMVGKWVVARVGANRLPRRKSGRRDEPRRVKPWHRAYSLLQKPRGEYRERGRSRVA